MKPSRQLWGWGSDGSRFPKMTSQDDVEAYLEAFKRTVAACKWDPSSWAVHIGPLLIGPAEAAYWLLPDQKAETMER